jgi:hypothetical protein
MGLSVLASDDKELFKLANVRVGKLGFEPGSYSVLIGWDMLRHARLNYDAPQRRFTLQA